MKPKILFVIVLLIASGPFLFVGYAEYEARKELERLKEDQQNTAMFVFLNSAANETVEVKGKFENGDSRWFVVPAGGELMASVPSGPVVIERYREERVVESYTIGAEAGAKVEFEVGAVPMEWK